MHIHLFACITLEICVQGRVFKGVQRLACLVEQVKVANGLTQLYEKEIYRRLFYCLICQD